MNYKTIIYNKGIYIGNLMHCLASESTAFKGDFDKTKN